MKGIGNVIQEQERLRKIRREALPLHNRRYVITYERLDHEVEVIAVNQESMAHAIYDAMLETIDQHQANRMAYTGKHFWFNLNLYRCPNPGTVSREQPNRWRIQVGNITGRVVPVSVHPTSGQSLLRGMNLRGYKGNKETWK